MVNTLYQKVKDICQYQDLNSKIKANLRSCTKHLGNSNISLTILCSVYTDVTACGSKAKTASILIAGTDLCCADFQRTCHVTVDYGGVQRLRVCVSQGSQNEVNPYYVCTAPHVPSETITDSAFSCRDVFLMGNICREFPT